MERPLRACRSSPLQEMEGGGAERRSLGGRIPEEVQQQARQKESPVLSELLVAARKGLTERVVQLLHQDPSNAAVTDKVQGTFPLQTFAAVSIIAHVSALEMNT